MHDKKDNKTTLSSPRADSQIYNANNVGAHNCIT